MFRFRKTEAVGNNLTEKWAFKRWHRVVEITDIRPVRDSSICWTGTLYRVPSICGLMCGLVNQVPCLGDALGVVGKKEVCLKITVTLSHNLVRTYIGTLREPCPGNADLPVSLCSWKDSSLGLDHESNGFRDLRHDLKNEQFGWRIADSWPKKRYGFKPGPAER